MASAYQQCFAYKLRKRGLRVDCEVLLPIRYDDEPIDAGYRIDMLIENCIIVENKAIDKLLPIPFDIFETSQLSAWVLIEPECEVHEGWIDGEWSMDYDTRLMAKK